jgi:hypothetical protein
MLGRYDRKECFSIARYDGPTKTEDRTTTLHAISTQTRLLISPDSYSLNAILDFFPE